MLDNPYSYYRQGRSAPTRVEIETERVSVDLGLKRQVREDIGTIIPNQFKNPTTNPTTFLPTHKRVELFSVGRWGNA